MTSYEFEDTKGIITIPYIQEQTKQGPKVKVQKDKQRSTTRNEEVKRRAQLIFIETQYVANQKL